MNKVIIAIYGRAAEGKSETIKNIIPLLKTKYPEISVDYLKNDGDILAILRLGNVYIGIESQGDPGSRMLSENTIEELIKRNCTIIVCATRTEGKTVGKVDELAKKYSFNTLWKSSYYTNGLNFTEVNQIAAYEIVYVIESIISGRI